MVMSMIKFDAAYRMRATLGRSMYEGLLDGVVLGRHRSRPAALDVPAQRRAEFARLLAVGISSGTASRCDAARAAPCFGLSKAAGYIHARRLLDEHRFRSLGKLIVGNLDRIADVDNIGN